MIQFFVAGLVLLYLAISGGAAVGIMLQQLQWERLQRLRRQDQLRLAKLLAKEDAP